MVETGVQRYLAHPVDNTARFSEQSILSDTIDHHLGWLVEET